MYDDVLYSGQDLLTQFKTQQAKIRPAIERMIAEADEIARGDRESVSFDELFSEED